MQSQHAQRRRAAAAVVIVLLASMAHAFVPMAAAPRPAAVKASSKNKAASTAALARATSPPAAAAVLEAPTAAGTRAGAAAVRPRRRRRRLDAQEQEREAESIVAAESAAATAEADDAAITPEEKRTRVRVRALQRAAAAVARQRELVKAWGRAPTEEELAASLALSPPALRAALEQGTRAREELAQGWKGLVHKLVARHATFLPASELADLVDEGFAGLMEAALRFRPTAGAGFQTYAFYWVRKRVLAAVAARDRTTFQSAGEHALGDKARAAMQAGYERTGRWPSLAEVAAVVGVSEARAAELLRRGERYRLLEGAMDGRVADTLSDPEAPGADGVLEALQCAEVEAGVAGALSQLPAEERAVLALRLGLRDGQPKSWEELGRLMHGCSVSYLRKVEARAKTHLRRNVDVVRLVHRRPAKSSASLLEV